MRFPSPLTPSTTNVHDTFVSQPQIAIEPLESRLLKSLQQTQQNKDEILQLIDELKKDDPTLSKTIDVKVEGGIINYSILGMIIEYGKEEIIKDLIDAEKDNIDINAVVKKNKDGKLNTALDVAMSKGEIEVIKTLLENGANYYRFSLIVEQKAFLKEINFFPNRICDHFLENTGPISLSENQKALATDLLEIHSASFDSFAELFLKENSNHSPSRYLKAGSFTCPLNAQDEIARIMKTKKVYYNGDLSITADEINHNYLKHICKKSGLYSQIINELQKKHQESVASESSQSSTETKSPSSVMEAKRKPETSEMQLFKSQSKSARGELGSRCQPS
jgi:ankyrin repeat protein